MIPTLKKLNSLPVILLLGGCYLINFLVSAIIVTRFQMATALTNFRLFELYNIISLSIFLFFLFFTLFSTVYSSFNAFKTKSVSNLKLGLTSLVILTTPFLGIYLFKELSVNSSWSNLEHQSAKYEAFQKIIKEVDVTTSFKLGDFILYPNKSGVDNASLTSKVSNAKLILKNLKKSYNSTVDLSIPLVITKDNRHFKESSKHGSSFGGSIFITKEVFDSDKFEAVLIHEYVHLLNFNFANDRNLIFPIFIDEVIAYSLEFFHNPEKECFLDDDKSLNEIFHSLSAEEELEKIIISPNEQSDGSHTAYKYMFYKSLGCNLLKDYSLDKILRWAVKTEQYGHHEAFKLVFNKSLYEYIEVYNEK